MGEDDKEARLPWLLRRSHLNTKPTGETMQWYASLTPLLVREAALMKRDRVFGETMRFHSPISGKTLDKSSDKSGKQGRAID